MSLNNVILPQMLIADLYKNTLLPINEPSMPASPAPLMPEKQAPGLQFLGKHLKKTTVFVYFKQDIYLPDAHLNFLGNVLKACNLNLADIAIINIAKQEVTVEAVKELLAPNGLIFFNVDPASIRLDCILPEFSIKRIDGMLLLRVPPLEKLNQNNEEGKLLKSKLWLCLKEFFTV
jgi:hypothetical protein